MDGSGPGGIPTVCGISGKRDGPVFCIWGMYDMGNRLHLYCLFKHYGYGAAMTTEKGGTDPLRLVMPVAFAIVETTTGDDCHQQYIDRYD